MGEGEELTQAEADDGAEVLEPRPAEIEMADDLMMDEADKWPDGINTASRLPPLPPIPSSIAADALVLVSSHPPSIVARVGCPLVR